MSRYQLWIHERDANGNPIDGRILTAAEEIGPDLTRYRNQEIDCESESNTLLQSAVEAASKATCNRAIENPSGYLTIVYRRIVDRFLDRQSRVVPAEDAFLEDLLCARHRQSAEKALHSRLLLEQLLNAMDPATRRICQWRLEGYSVREIARELQIAPNYVSTQYARGVKRAAKKVLERSQGP